MIINVQIINGVETAQKLQAISKNTEMGVQDVLDEAAEMSAEKMKYYAPEMTGELRDSIDWSRDGISSRIIGTIKGVTGHQYAEAVERGAMAHMPNVDDIATRYAVSGKVAWAIAKKIAGNRGPARHFGEMTAAWLNGSFYSMVKTMVVFAVNK